MPIRKKCGRVEWAGEFSTKFSGLSETVPDTHDTIFTRVKIGKSIGVYSANTRNKYGVYRVYGVFGDLLCAAGRIPAV